MAKDKRLTLLKQANKLYRQGKIDAAIKQYKQILEIKPDDLEVRRIAGDLLLKQNVVDEAVSQFEWIADYYLKEGFYAKAIAMYKRITRVDQGRENVYIKLAELYTKQGLIMEAKQIYLDLVEECKRTNKQKRALDIYKKILEFDRSNDKMRLLLADNYLKEGLIDEAVEEYLLVVDLYTTRDELDKSIDLLRKVYKDSNSNIRILNKLVSCYTSASRELEAVELLKSLGDSLRDYPELFKKLGEIYFSINRMEDAEAIYLKVVEMNPEETEIVMKLGKVYLQREDVNRAYEVFLPAIEKSIENKKYDEATALLRFIIASENSYIPALQKLASVFKLSGKENNLIALYESMIPVYHAKGFIDDERKILKELISISESPFTYQEQLAALDGGELSAAGIEESAESSEKERETEFVTFNMRIVDEALAKGDKFKAEDILKKTRAAFPSNLEICEKQAQFYKDEKRFEEYLSEGKHLLELYLQKGMKIEYEELLDELSRVKPEDENLVELSANEQTSIELDFDVDEINEQMYEIESNEAPPAEEDVMVLSNEDSVDNIELPVDPHESSKAKSFASAISELDFYISNNMLDGAQELAEMLKQLYPDNSELFSRINRIQSARRETDKEVIAAEEKISSVTGDSDSGMDLPKVDFEVLQNKQPESDFSALDSGFDFKVESNMVDGAGAEADENKEIQIELDSPLPEVSDIEINLDSPVKEGGDIEIELTPSSEEFQLETFHIDEPVADEAPAAKEISGFNMSFGNDAKESSDLDIAFEAPAQDVSLEIELPEPIQEEAVSEISFDEPEIEVSLDSEPVELSGEESGAPQIEELTFEESEIEVSIEPPQPVETVSSAESDISFDEMGELEVSLPEPAGEEEHLLELELPEDDIRAGDETGEMPAIVPGDKSSPDLFSEEIEVLMPDVTPEESEPAERSMPLPEDSREFLFEEPEFHEAPSVKEEEAFTFELDDRSEAEPPVQEEQKDIFSEASGGFIVEPEAIDNTLAEEFPFEGNEEDELLFNLEESVLGEQENLWYDYYETEGNVAGELASIEHWMQDLERQRTSTIEKNMMEIFDEFKKGVEEKIGQEDYDTRYNLGIAYKEMGLIEEAIHEFLIASRHPLKFFDSAGLLGICFRDKGMFDDAVNWFERALEAVDRVPEEYRAVKYEMVLTLMQKEDYSRALTIAGEIQQEDGTFRDIGNLITEIKVHI